MSILRQNVIADPLASLADLKAFNVVGVDDTVIIAVKALGLFRWDKTSTASGDDFNVVVPTLQGLVGRWIKITSNSEAIPFTGTYYVDGGRTDSYTADGSQAFPFKTIQAAVNAVATTVIATGVTIRIARGTYIENVVIENNNLRMLAFIGDESRQTIIQPASGLAIECESNNANLSTIIGKNIVFNAVVSFVGAAATFLSLGGTFDNCIFIGNPVFNTGGAVTIRNSTIVGSPNITSFASATLSNNYVTGGITAQMTLGTSAINLSFCFFTLGVTHNIGIIFSQGCIFGGTLSCNDRWDSTEDVFESGSAMTVATGGILNRFGSIVKGTTTTTGSGVINQAIEPVSSVAADLVAHAGGGQANATPAYARIIHVATVASGSDSIKLKPAKMGDWCMIYNADGGNNLAVYCQSGEYMNGNLDDFQVVAAGSAVTVMYAASDAHWAALGTSVPP